MPHQPIDQDSINWSGQISTIQLLCSTSQFLFVFFVNFIDGKEFEQWLDIYDFYGTYLSSIELPLNKKPLFADIDNNIWFIKRDVSSQPSNSNRNVFIERWKFIENEK